MPRSRTFSITGTTPAAPPRSRTLRVTGTGTAASVPRSRVLRVTGSGATALILNPLVSLIDVEPETLIAVTATAVGGVVPDSWTWRKVSGLDLGITGTTGSVTIRAPSSIVGGVSVIGVTATKDGVVSPERTMSISVLPQTKWSWTGTVWAPRVTTWA